jgi:hypothetical protein
VAVLSAGRVDVARRGALTILTNLDGDEVTVEMSGRDVLSGETATGLKLSGYGVAVIENGGT